MDALQFLLALLAVSVAAGVVGSIAGLGGGVLLIPVLTIILGVDIKYAIGASIVSVIATSSGAAAAYVRDHITNLRIGMFLEIATTLGAVTGAFIAGMVSREVLFFVFGVALLVSLLPLLKRLGEELPQAVKNDWFAQKLRLAGSYPDRSANSNVAYQVTAVPAGFGMMYLAGVLSGLLGIGSGAFKVLAMDNAMRLPMKVSTTTSNFMIGVTAAASAGVYFARGDVNPFISAPVALGVLAGAALGTRILVRVSNSMVRKIFVPVLALIALEMLLRGLGVHT